MANSTSFLHEGNIYVKNSTMSKNKIWKVCPCFSSLTSSDRAKFWEFCVILLLKGTSQTLLVLKVEAIYSLRWRSFTVQLNYTVINFTHILCIWTTIKEIGVLPGGIYTKRKFLSRWSNTKFYKYQMKYGHDWNSLLFIFL